MAAVARSAAPEVRPVLKWAGGKTRLLPELLARMPAQYGRYYEPFAGGAALFFAVQPERAVLGDANADLIACYRAIAENVERVIWHLRHHLLSHCEGYYTRMRLRWNDPRATWEPDERAGALLYMNRAGFNGLYRVNSDGEFNVPWGKRAATIFDLANLRAAAVALARADLRASDYRATVADAGAGDFVFMDSPYDRTWTGYTAGAFGPDDQRELAETARGLVGRGCHVMLSNSDTPFVRDLYAGWRIDVVKCDRRINSSGAGRGAVDEVVIVGEAA